MTSFAVSAVLALTGTMAVEVAAAAPTATSATAGVEYFSVAPGPYRPGDAVTVTYSLSNVSGVVKVRTLFRNTFRTFEFVDLSPEPGTDTMRVVIPTSAYTGDYAFAGLSVTYSDGTTTYHAAAGKPYFNVTGTAYDGEPPRLASLTLTKAATHADGESTYAYTVTDDSALQRVRIHLGNAVTGAEAAETAESPSKSGTFTLGVGTAGPTSVTQVTLLDVHGNSSHFVADGTAQGFVAPHTVDFAALTIALKPAKDDSVLRSMPRSVHLSWFAPAAFGKAISGYTVTVNPGGRVYQVDRGAIFTPWDGYRQSLKVPGLTNGVTYTVTTVARSEWGSGRVTTRTVTPMMSTNVFSPGDLTGDKRADVVAFKPAGRLLTDGSSQFVTPIYGYKGSGTGKFSGRSTLYELGVFSRVAARGQRDLYDRASSYFLDQGQLRLVSPSKTVSSSSAWARMRFLDGGSDFSGDGIPDLLAVASTGELYRYRMNSVSGIVDKKQLSGGGWNYFLAVFSPGDFNGDRKADVVAVDTAGRMWLYRGNGTGGWLSPRIQIGSGWHGFGAVLPLRDFNGDGRVDIGAIRMTGELLLYPGNGRGGFSGSPRQIGSGWNQFF